MDPLQLLGMVLDVTDAVIGTVAIVSLWYAWPVPAKQDPRPKSCHVSGRAEIDRFLRKARSCTDAGADHVREEDEEQAKGVLPRSGQC